MKDNIANWSASMSSEINHFNSHSIVADLLERDAYTPDFYKLREFKEVPLFVYGTFKRDHADSHYLSDAKYLGVAHTVTPHYTMMDDGLQPIVFHNYHDENRRKFIRGEVYMVSVGHIHCIDRLLGNTMRFERQIKKISLEQQNPENPYLDGLFKELGYIQAFIHLGVSEWWAKHKLSSRTTYRLTQDNKLANKPMFEWNKVDEGWNHIPRRGVHHGYSAFEDLHDDFDSFHNYGGIG